MILINLLPHRAERDRRRRALFYSMTGFAVVIAAALAFFWYLFVQQSISAQRGRNSFLEGQIKVLEAEIQDVASLRKEIDALKARQSAVENLQVGRNMPVNILDELVRQAPEGVYLTSISQESNSLSVVGKTLSNERISDFLRKTTNSGWFNKPELIAIEVSKGSSGLKDKVRLLDFAMKIGINSPQDKAAPPAGAASSPNVVVPKV